MTQTIIKEVATYAIDKIENGFGSNPYGCDLQNEIYNTDYFKIYTSDAKEWIEENVGAFEAIGEVVTYEQDNFGQVSTDLSSPCAVCNMFVYIKGNELLNECPVLQNKWNERLTNRDLNNIKKWLDNQINN